jgi:hypothetical protein
MKKNGGTLGSNGHEDDRREFARLFSEGLLKDHEIVNDPTFSRSKTKTTYNCKNIPVTIRVNVETETKTDYSRRNLQQTDFCHVV